MKQKTITGRFHYYYCSASENEKLNMVLQVPQLYSYFETGINNCHLCLKADTIYFPFLLGPVG
jgi:hypothetical protein